jgi:hypothetical protein
VGKANGPRKARPDDRLREAIQERHRGKDLDCFGALRLAMVNPQFSIRLNQTLSDSLITV